ncbi:MAG: bifunctional glutamate N-acetyltransferase/amino-acid acetyltransferase ArgJ [Candidatus Nanopelagicales bacterium]|nr:bifunctional glutamate N-acetyltransferase/amino-acid acetyltransferase ArgJ [Candidatus Nanopelagicales bacterium]MCF8538795.1 bifunctional glutamate N-acetyltransferase/amino-acid acetyltransferase ArgJ [Candidatus Nanopelagicales bacterium]MCF8550723.1 bifunctional glutamate N-acetyltransferase/amino-acid acetyltransferase ArgJ [Candidatus Nanopelagicales bacterium]
MSVTAAQGFRAAGVRAGLKQSGNPDVAVIVNDGPSDVAVAVFTTNAFAAAPVIWSRQVVADGSARVVVVNSGGANACTGPDGFADTHATAEHAAELAQAAGHEVGAGEVVVCSTGLIGERLPMEKLCTGVDSAFAQANTAGGESAAIAIMTTDTVPKVSVVSGAGYVVGGMAKGAGMLAPGLATMLVFLTSDAQVSRDVADSALRRATAYTFDRIDSDGCMSTNDTVLLMANGASGVTPDSDEFASVVRAVCADLARQLIADAEGASKDIEITVTGAATESDALEAARAIGRSNLLKCAIHGEDPNWGRVLSALGTTAATFNPSAVDVAINGVTVCRGGGIGDSRDLVNMSEREVAIDVSLAAGNHTATIWTNDLTADYVHENSAYST